MERVSFFSSPLFLGFERFEQLIDTMSKAQDNTYPPYNIEQIGEHGFRITLALAGFHKDSIHISVSSNQMTIRGKQDPDPSAIFIYRGIATRQFIKNFILADGVEVNGAEFDNGLLHINLSRQQNDDNTRTIEITSPVDASSTRKMIDG